MSWTKRQYIEQAFNKIGLGSFAYDADPEDLQDALTELDAMMAEWSERGIDIGWPLSADPKNAKLETDTGAPDRANTAIFYNLAVRLAPDYGRTIAATVHSTAQSSFKRLLAHYTKIPKMIKGRRLSGAGNRRINATLPRTESDTIGAPEQQIGYSND